MSRIGRKPVDVPSGVTVKIAGPSVEVQGPLSKNPLQWTIPPGISAAMSDDGKQVMVTRSGDDKQSRASHGLTRALIANMVNGVHKGYERGLLIFGAGYGCKMERNMLMLNCGFMGRGSKDKYQFELPIPDGLTVDVETPNSRSENDPAKFVVRGADKQVLGDFVAKVRSIRPPEPYKGKGIRYEDEFVQRKAGKALAGG